MKYLFVAVFILVYVFFGIEPGYTLTSPLYTHFTYMFAHAGVIHLVLNSAMFIGMFRGVENLGACTKGVLTLTVITSGFAASLAPFACFTTPTVGSSSMIYALIGIYLIYAWGCKAIKIINRPKFITYIICICVSLVISYFKPSSNFPLHVLSLLAGGVSGICMVMHKPPIHS
jgi:membrane associated rhomboid family serine protease